MASLQEYSYLSEVVYNVGRNDQNKIQAIDIGWVEVKYIEKGTHYSA